jgi:hypothetical protein
MTYCVIKYSWMTNAIHDFSDQPKYLVFNVKNKKFSITYEF